MRKGIDCKGVEWEERELVEKKDLTGYQFDRLIVLFPINRLNKVDNKRRYWLCQCKCGNFLVARGDTLGRTVFSCGCIKLDTIYGRSKRIQDEMIGQRFGKLVVIEFAGYKTKSTGTKEAMYRCRCDCGNENFIVSGNSLRTGYTRSCGCYIKEILRKMNMKNLTNQRFGKLVALYPIDESIDNSIVWCCKCDCGEYIYVPAVKLIRGSITSCGCEENVRKSIGERKIESIFKNNQISYKSEYTFENLRSEKDYLLRYDFAVLNEFNQLVRLIEFDGKQHERPYDYFGGEEKFLELQYHDFLKNQYALSHNIPLVRIPYSKRDTMTLEDLLGDTYLITDLQEPLVI